MGKRNVPVAAAAAVGVRKKLGKSRAVADLRKLIPATPKGTGSLSGKRGKRSRKQHNAVIRANVRKAMRKQCASEKKKRGKRGKRKGKTVPVASLLV